jgi:hypothetical protein
MIPEGRPLTVDEAINAAFANITGDYFRAFQIPLLAGRVWVLDSAGNLTARDPKTLEVTFRAAVPGTENGGWLTAADGHLWIATSKVLYEYDPGTTSVGETDFTSVTVGGDASFTAVASDGRWLWDSVCTDIGRRHCVLERRDAKDDAARPVAESPARQLVRRAERC